MPPRKKVIHIEREDCQSCVYYSEDVDNIEIPADGYGFCRRNPPKMSVTEVGVMVSPTATKADWWCGEYKRKLQS